MTSDSSTPPEAGSTGSDATSETESTVPEDLKIRWAVVVPAVLIAAAVLLVGLPLGAVLIMNSTGCCLGNGPEKIITFWASMIAGFLALFGMLVTGVFVITSLRVEATARVQAQLEAQKTAKIESQATAKRTTKRFIRKRKGEMFEELERATDDVALVAAQAKELNRKVEKSKGDLEKSKKELEELKDGVTTLQNEAMNARTAIDEAQQQTMNLANEAQQTIDGAREQIDAGANEAQQAINGAREQTTSLASGAQRTIDGAREQITTVANEAQGTIDRASQQVEQQRGEAIGAIDNARQDVETAARAARDRIDRAGESPQGGDESR